MWFEHLNQMAARRDKSAKKAAETIRTIVTTQQPIPLQHNKQRMRKLKMIFVLPAKCENRQFRTVLETTKKN